MRRPTSPVHYLTLAVLLLGLVALVFAASATAQAEPCAFRTGNNATLVFVDPPSRGIEPFDAVSVFVMENGECVSRREVTGGNFAMAVWEDDPVTPTRDGAVPGDALGLRVERDGGEVYEAPLGIEFGSDLIWINSPYPADSLAAALVELATVADSLKQSNVSLSSEVATLTTRRNALQARVTALEADVARLQAELDSAPSEQEVLARIAEAIQRERTDIWISVRDVIRGMRTQ